MGIKDFVVCFSSSLDDLDVDRRSGGVSDRSHVHNPPRVSSEAMASSRDGLDLSNHLQLEVFDTVLICVVFLLSKSLKTCEKCLNLKGKNAFPLAVLVPLESSMHRVVSWLLVVSWLISSHGKDP